MKRTILCILLAIVLSGCSINGNGSSVSSSDMSSAEFSEHIGNALHAYHDSFQNQVKKDSYAVGVKNTYTMSYSDDSEDIFSFDGVLEVQDANTDPIAHMTQHIASGGVEFNSEGYYYSGRLYNDYNGIQYYEDMDFSSLQQTLLVPVNPYEFQDSMITTMKAEEGKDGSIQFAFSLDKAKAGDLFSDRYDSYGLKSYEDYEVISSKIIDIFDSEGHFVKEKAEFDIQVSYEGQEVKIHYSSVVDFLKINHTEVSISDEKKNALNQFVNYKDIDVDSISQGETYDDRPEDTIEATFKKRLVNRLGYKEISTNVYRDEFNTNEMYSIDFNNHTFSYSRYSIEYIYNWKTDVGAMDACTYDFRDNQKGIDCEDTTLETIQDVKSYLEMELYYCGLSLDDLQAETNS